MKIPVYFCFSTYNDEHQLRAMLTLETTRIFLSKKTIPQISAR